ncbi:MAG: hypothetical protein AAGD25_13900 [Cyanobacteria bacterium P01_F01_bin.150]
MDDRAPYWQQITLTSGGHIERLVQPQVQAFIHRLDAELNLEPTSERALQHYLMTVYGGTSPVQALAEECLRNVIAYILYQRCVTLAKRFGNGQANPHAPITQTPFTAIELFCCIFESPISLKTTASPTDQTTDREFYDPLTAKILDTFDPAKGGLASWCTTCLQGSRAVKRFLRDHGVVLETDWQLLCRMRKGKFRRILIAENCAPTEIERHTQLLEAFHQVYRTQIHERRQSSGSRRPYPAPMEQQLIEMGDYLSLPAPVDTPSLRNRLRTLAQYVRQDRCRGPSPPTPQAVDQAPDSDIEQLLEHYCQPCLAQAVEQTIDHRLTCLQQKRRGDIKAAQFLHAMMLFYCHSQPMKEIAATVGLRDQSSVSRLLERNSLQADIRRQLLAYLLQRISTLATATRSIDSLQSLDQQIAAFLEPYVERIIAADKREGYTSKNRQMTSVYATQLCQYATARRKSL